jgi:hypothetical protein
MQPMLSDDSLVTADAGYHSEANLKALAELGVDALIADNGMDGTSALPHKGGTSKRPIRCTTSSPQRRKQRTIGPRTSTMTPTVEPASVRRARPCIAMAATAYSMAMRR